MILLDTHIWVWWVNESADLSKKHRSLIESKIESGLGVSIISCWEVAKLVERGRLGLSLSLSEWIDAALAYPGVTLVDLSPAIAIESTQLPGDFHRDPADQIIVATARIHDIELLTADGKILNYDHVKLIS